MAVLKEKIVRHGTMLLVGKILCSVISIFTSLLLVRHLGSERFGTFSVTFAIVFFFQIIPLVIDQIVIRELSVPDSDRALVLGNAVFLKLALSAFSFLVCIPAVFAMNLSSEVRVFVVIAALSLFSSVGTTFTGLFQISLNVGAFAVPEVLVTLAFSLGNLSLIFLKVDLIFFIVMQTMLLSTQNLVYLIFGRNRLPLSPRFQWSWGIQRKILSDVPPLFLSGIFNAINLRVDQVFLFTFLSAKELGVYAADVRIVETLHLLPTVFSALAYPVLCKRFQDSKKGFAAAYRVILKFLNLFIVPVATATFLLAPKIIALAFGPEYESGGPALSVLMFSEICVYFGIVNNNLLLAAGQQDFIFVSTFLGAVTNVVLNLLLIPSYGIIGAAISTLISYSGLSYLYQLYKPETRPFLIDFVALSIKPLLCSAIMFFSLVLSKEFNLGANFLIGLGVYSISIFLLKAVTREDLDFLLPVPSEIPRGSPTVQS